MQAITTSNHMNGHRTAITFHKCRHGFRFHGIPLPILCHPIVTCRYVSKHFGYMSEYRGEANLRKGQFSARIRIRSDGTRKFPSHITIPPRNSFRELHTNYQVARCVHVCVHCTYTRVSCRRYSHRLDFPKQLCVRKAIVYAPFDTSSNVITYIIGHETGRSTSYSLTLVLRKLQRKHNRGRRLMV